MSEINEKGIIPGAYITLVLKDSFNGLDPENSGAAQAIFSTVALLQTDGGVSGVIGDVSSALTVQSALLTSRLSIPQCSYSAGSSKMFLFIWSFLAQTYEKSLNIAHFFDPIAD